jgi:hypothetical protein
VSDAREVPADLVFATCFDPGLDECVAAVVFKRFDMCHSAPAIQLAFDSNRPVHYSPDHDLVLLVDGAILELFRERRGSLLAMRQDHETTGELVKSVYQEHGTVQVEFEIPVDGAVISEA